MSQQKVLMMTVVIVARCNVTKPPIGLKPRHIHETDRQHDIIHAIIRWHDAGKQIPGEWVKELKWLLDSDIYKQ